MQVEVQLGRIRRERTRTARQRWMIRVGVEELSGKVNPKTLVQKTEPGWPFAGSGKMPGLHFWLYDF